jgi:hypothetical protein
MHRRPQPAGHGSGPVVRVGHRQPQPGARRCEHHKHGPDDAWAGPCAPPVAPGSWPPSAAEVRCLYRTLRLHLKTSNLFPESSSHLRIPRKRLRGIGPAWASPNTAPTASPPTGPEPATEARWRKSRPGPAELTVAAGRFALLLTWGQFVMGKSSRTGGLLDSATAGAYAELAVDRAGMGLIVLSDRSSSWPISRADRSAEFGVSLGHVAVSLASRRALVWPAVSLSVA